LIVPASALPATPEPPSQQAVIHVVQPGETLFRIALRYGTTVWALVSSNQLENPSVIYAGQRLLIPSGEAGAPGMQPLDAITVSLPFSSVHVVPQTIVQGNVLVITVSTVKAMALQGSFLDWIIPFAGSDGAYTALIGVHAMQKPGVYPLVLTATDEKGHQVATSVDVQIVAGKFGQERINLPPDKQALLDPVLVQAEREKLWSVFGIFRQERYWSGLFALPAQGKVSSVFGTRRTYSGGAFNTYHEGIDFSAGVGTPVYAPAAGLVVLAEPLAVRGTAVILDHGWGVHSGFYHLSEIIVSPGQLVQAGELVGRVGNTGLSTGAHLHWDLRVRGVNVDPLEWTRRAIP
jgi:murein DD-endopeptidase MepM/ murein hydrolase activator NlpD